MARKNQRNQGDGLTFVDPVEQQQELAAQEQAERPEPQQQQAQAQAQAQAQQIAEQQRKAMEDATRCQKEIAATIINGKYNWDVGIYGLLMALRVEIIAAAKTMGDEDRVQLKRFVENYIRNDIYLPAGMHFF